ncbi:PTS system IIA component (Glc family) [Muricomes intestini]|uniref:PTS system IIA component (Glc family) n=1 Tax=Muricomes intestini TaxID=1796634 RepID=A0A4R3KEQ1_9FIRM|nr:PTS glucose transporter subunit IIA [Muricomes intestini]TCS81708.1 PTS system IIA component (Glc family) [Muricomes intestini]
MFKFLKKEKEHWLGSPVKGKTVLLQEVKDPTFSEEMLGKGIGVIPSDNGIYAPADGEITMVFDTLHAVSMMTEYGTEILIHVGLDTVEMKGEGFVGHVKAGDKVKKGNLLLNVDINKVRERGYDPITLMVICNTGDYALVEGISKQNVLAGDDVLFIQEK